MASVSNIATSMTLVAGGVNWDCMRKMMQVLRENVEAANIHEELLLLAQERNTPTTAIAIEN